MTLTPDRIAELRRLHAAATPGPWGIDDGIEVDDRGNAHKVGPAVITAIGLDVESLAGVDTDLIAAARNSLSDLLDAAEERDVKDELIAAHRAELCLAYDVIDALPESALEGIDDAKLLNLMRRMDDEQKRAEIRDKMSDLVQERDRLRALLRRVLTDWGHERGYDDVCATLKRGEYHGPCDCGFAALEDAINEATKDMP